MKSDIPDPALFGAQCVAQLTVDDCPHKALDEQDILRALKNPVSKPGNSANRSVFDAVKPGNSVCIVVSDHTRKTAADLVLPVLLKGLQRAGCSSDDMFILFASGIHRHPTADEVGHILGARAADLFRNRIFMHDPDNSSNLVAVGVTRTGHQVRINRRAVEANRLLVIGGVVYHYHAGFGGGRKSIVPGLAARETIAHNHGLTLDPNADRIHPRVAPGILEGNPVAEEMLEAATMCRTDCVVCTVLTPAGKLAAIFAGDMRLSHAAACEAAGRMYRRDLDAPADIVVASAGNASNWIQAHKALFNAHRAVRPDGIVVLLAACPEGLGSEEFRHWMTMPDSAAMFSELRRNPAVLGQTALSTREKARNTILVASLPQDDVVALGMRRAPDPESALRTAVEEMRAARGRPPTCCTMPDALYTVPFVQQPVGLEAKRKVRQAVSP
jgi:nickel-dependent lactate racemase